MFRGSSVLFLVACAIVPPTLAEAQPQFEAPQVVSIKAYAFDQYAGKLSTTDVLSDDFEGSWNDTKSSALLVVVELSGPKSRVYDGSLGPGSRFGLKLVVTELGRSKQLLNRSRVLPVAGGDGRLFVSYFIEPSFCHVVRFVATVVGKGAAAPTDRRANFACGE